MCDNPELIGALVTLIQTVTFILGAIGVVYVWSKLSE